MKYARRAPGMILFEVQQGFVARGASIAWLSQYPKEEDIFLPPLTALEVSGSRIEGAVVVVELRPSMQANISGLRSGAQDLAKFDRLMDEAAKRRGGQGLKPVRCYANGSHSAGAKAVWCYANAARCCAGTDDACAQHTSGPPYELPSCYRWQGALRRVPIMRRLTFNGAPVRCRPDEHAI